MTDIPHPIHRPPTTGHFDWPRAAIQPRPSLRTTIAAQILAGMVANPDTAAERGETQQHFYRRLCIQSFALADVFLATLEEQRA